MAQDNDVLYEGALPKPLTTEETEKYFQLAKTGDEKAKIKLKEHNVRLVVYIVKTYFSNVTKDNPSLETDDLIGIGTIGLMKAVETFDADKGAKFATYASRVISNEILMAIRKVKNLKQNDSLEEALNLDEDGNELSLNNVLASDEDLEIDFIKNETSNIVRNSLDILNNLERQVVDLYYGFKGERLNHNQIGQKLGYSRSYISRIDNSARKKLAVYLQEQSQGEISKLTEEMIAIRKMPKDDATLLFANSIIDKSSSIEELAKIAGMSASNLKINILRRLPSLDNDLYEKVKDILDQMKSDTQQKKQAELELKKQLKTQKKAETQKLRELYQKSYEIKSKNADIEKPEGEESVIMEEKLLLELLPDYTVEQINFGLSGLLPEEREFLLQIHPLEKGEPSKLLSIAKQSNIDLVTIKNKVNEIIDKIVSFLEAEKSESINVNKKNIIKIKTNNLFDYFPENTKEQVLYAIMSLNDMNKEIIELRYGLNGKEVTEPKVIATKLNLKYSTLTVRIVNIRDMIAKRLLKNTTAIKSGTEKKPVKVKQKSTLNSDKKKTKKETTTILMSKPKYSELQIKAAESYLEMALNLFNSKQIVKSELKFLKALASENQYTLQKTNYYLGKIYMIKKKPNIAENYFKTSLQFNDKDYDALLEMGKALFMQEKYDEAIKYFDECGKINPNYINHIIEKGKSYAFQKDFESAFREFDLAISKRNNDYYAHLEKGNLLYNLGRLDEAKDELSLCNNSYSRILHKSTLGKIEYLKGNKEEAYQFFDECINDDLKKNGLYFISNIGHFFHQRNEKELAYKYYSKSYIFKKWLNISDSEVEKHLKQHTNNKNKEKMHSIFNFPVSLDLLNELIKNMEKTSTREMYDVYQIYCKDAGYMVIDENNQEQEDYITILTLPFTKKVMQSYPDFKLPDIDIKESIKVEDIIANIDIKSEEDIQEKSSKIIIELPSEKKQQLSSSEKKQKTFVTEKVEPKSPEVSLNNEKLIPKVDETLQKSEDVDIIESVKVEDIKSEKIIPRAGESLPKSEPVIEINDEADVTIITNKFPTPISLEFEKYKDLIKMLIDRLDDPSEQVFLLLRLGYVRNQSYTEEQIGQFFGLSEFEVSNIINSGLSRIVGFSAMTLNGVESARQHLSLTNKSKLN